MSNHDKVNLSGHDGYFEHKNSKPLTRPMIEAAMGKTMSNHGAARYLNVSFSHYKKFAKLYFDQETGKSLYEIHKNPSGKGIPKLLPGTERKRPLIDLVEGRLPIDKYNPEKLRIRLVQEGWLLEECHQCGFKERRVLDYKIPLLLRFKDGNKKNYRLENIEHLCYNCYFLTVGDVFTDRDIKNIEHYAPLRAAESDTADWGLDEYQLQRLRELGLEDFPPLDDGSEFISKW